MMRAGKFSLWIIGLSLGIVLLLIIGLVIIAMFNPFHRHEHCMKITGIALRTYAFDNGGTFPYDTNGFGNALLQLIKAGALGDTNGLVSVRYLTGPGDEGSVFKVALKSGGRVPEESCSRIYIQGLSETNNPNIAIIFDKQPTPGGDHGRRPWGPLRREVCMLDGTMQVIPEPRWKEFSKEQIELLVREGIDRAAATRCHQLAESASK
jgi:hypothetical protein